MFGFPPEQVLLAGTSVLSAVTVARLLFTGKQNLIALRRKARQIAEKLEAEGVPFMPDFYRDLADNDIVDIAKQAEKLHAVLHTDGKLREAVDSFLSRQLELAVKDPVKLEKIKAAVVVAAKVAAAGAVIL